MIAIELIKQILEDEDNLGMLVAIMLNGKLIPITNNSIDIIEDEDREHHVVLTVNTGESR